VEFSIVIPCYNEEKNIGSVLRKIKQVVKSNAEIIVVDDGSVDNTAKEAAENGAKVVRHSINKGKGTSIIEGIALAKNDIILFIDGDGQDDPEDIPNLLRPIKEGADFVIGSRWLGELKKGAISRLNYLVTDFITRIINLLFEGSITDSQAGFRCIRKGKFRKIGLGAKGYEIETEMLIKALKNKMKVVEVPVTRSKRLYGKTKMKRYKLGVTLLFLTFREVIFS